MEVTMRWKLIGAVSLLVALSLFLVVREVISQAPPPVPSIFPNATPEPIVVNQKAKPVNIWSLQFKQLETKNVIIATCDKKTPIQITSDSVDLQTQKGIFLAQGHVEVSGPEIRCRSERLLIHLHEDHLYLDGKVNILMPRSLKGQFELSGEQITLSLPDGPVEVKTDTKIEEKKVEEKKSERPLSKIPDAFVPAPPPPELLPPPPGEIKK
jgi:hypothetical protein